MELRDDNSLYGHVDGNPHLLDELYRVEGKAEII